MAIQSSSGGSKPPAHKRLVAPEATAAESDGGRDEGLRPRRLCDYIGQSELKQVLGIAVEATRLRNDALDTKGLTLIPLNIHLKGSWIKLTIGLGKGRKLHDKRQEERRKQDQKDLRSALKRY